MLMFGPSTSAWPHTHIAHSGSRRAASANALPAAWWLKPYIMRNTDALQNLTEALLAVQVLAPGVYVAMHNRVLQFPGVVKDRERGTFRRA